MITFIGFLLIVLVVVGIISIALLYSAISWGTVFYLFWYWFVLPVFTELPQITFTQAMGLFLFITLFKTQMPQVLKDDYVNKKQGQIAGVLSPWIILLIGYLLKLMIIH